VSAFPFMQVVARELDHDAANSLSEKSAEVSDVPGEKVSCTGRECRAQNRFILLGESNVSRQRSALSGTSFTFLRRSSRSERASEVSRFRHASSAEYAEVKSSVSPSRQRRRSPAHSR